MNLKQLILGAASISLTICSACSGNSVNKNESSSDSMSTESEKIQSDVTAKEIFNTPDLAFAEVKDHVKKITETFDNQEYVLYEFDDNGFYKSGSRLEHVHNIQRDAENHIISGDNGYYQVVWEDGKVKQTVINESDGTLLTETFSYNEDGNLVKKECSSEGPDGDYSYTLTYSYGSDSFDKNGNWVSRQVKSTDKDNPNYQEKRKIYYN